MVFSAGFQRQKTVFGRVSLVPLTFGSLFAGIGGFDLGFERAGLVCKWQVEINGYAKKVLEKHWPDVPRWDDVRTFPPAIRKKWRVDVICGGFPCQDISYAGRGAGLEGERSGLFFEAVRVVQQLRPRILVLENVAALLTRGLDVVLGTLAEVGYDAEWDCIPAAAVGAPHIRDRVFILAFRRGCLADADCNECRIKAGSRPGSGRNREADETQGRGRVSHKTGREGSCQDVANAGRHQAGGGEAVSGQATKRNQGITDIGDGGGQWIVEPDVGRVAHGIPARLDRLRGLGNAVVPQVAEYIGRRIIAKTNN
jgi:DNA (cytosine-5)-methyltransferase 1